MKHAKQNTRQLVLTGLLTALVFLFTFVVKVPVPFTSGYIHLGDAMIFLSVLAVGPIHGAFAAGVGSMLSDLLGGYAQYALPTLVIKSVMALLMGLAMAGRTRRSAFLSAGTVTAVWGAFLALLYAALSDAVSQYGGKLSAIVFPGGGAEELAAADRMAGNLPVYLLAAFVAVTLVVALAAWFLSRRDAKGAFSFRALIGMSAGGMCMIIGYFLTEAFLMGYGVLPATFSVPMNLLQFAGGVLIAAALSPAVARARTMLAPGGEAEDH